MFILKNEVQFDMAHYLSGYDGKCANIHGHRYRLVVKIAKGQLYQQGQLRGMVEDFGYVKEVLHEVADFFDHKLLLEENEEGTLLATQLAQLANGFAIQYVPFRTTAEEMARFIYQMIQEKGLPVVEVELFETPTNSCIYREDV